MGIKIYHQTGHNAVWNKDSALDGVGDGLIFSPVHINSQNLKKYPASLKEKSLFDPQFYLPSSQKKNFKTYPFFPETMMDSFKTIDFSLLSLESARLCLEFQVEENFEAIVIPARFFEQMDPEYIRKQEELTVEPFMKALSERDDIKGKDVFLTLPVTSHMIESDGFLDNLLNWVTSYPEISGIYLICQYERSTKQVCDSQYLYKYMQTMYEIQEADLKVIVGYSNTESLLYSVTGDPSITIGAFENTRLFSLDKFLISEGERRGPKARVYVPGLLNWIHFEQAKIIKQLEPDLWNEMFVATHHSDEVFSATKEPNFQTNSLYKHYFEVFSNQVYGLNDLSQVDRYKNIKKQIIDAENYHMLVRDIPVDLDVHGSDGHLQSWKDALNLFYAQNLKPS